MGLTKKGNSSVLLARHGIGPLWLAETNATLTPRSRLANLPSPMSGAGEHDGAKLRVPTSVDRLIL